MLEVRKLRCEYRENPIGLDVLHPRISWQLHSDQRGTMQKAYQIQVFDEAGDSLNLQWDSGVVQSDQSVHVEVSPLVIKPCQRYQYRVQAWDLEGNTSG